MRRSSTTRPQLVKPAHLLSKTVGYEGVAGEAAGEAPGAALLPDRAYEEDPFGDGYRRSARY